jgi:hypothetical protein
VLEDGDVEAATDIGGPGLQQGHAPDLSKIRTYSHSHWLAPDEDTCPAVEPRDATEESPFLGDISRGRFWLIFIGILFSYFVSRVVQVSNIPFWQRRCRLGGFGPRILTGPVFDGIHDC